MSGDGGDRGFSAENRRSGPETGYIEVGTFCSVLIELFSKAVWYLRYLSLRKSAVFAAGSRPGVWMAWTITFSLGFLACARLFQRRPHLGPHKKLQRTWQRPPIRVTVVADLMRCVKLAIPHTLHHLGSRYECGSGLPHYLSMTSPRQARSKSRLPLQGITSESPRSYC